MVIISPKKGIILTQNTRNFADAAGRYALSLFEISSEEKVLVQIEQNIKFIDLALNSFTFGIYTPTTVIIRH